MDLRKKGIRRRRMHVHVKMIDLEPYLTSFARCAASRTWTIPRDAEETAQQARAAVQRAYEAGVTRQRIELLLPLIGATDLDDW